MHAPSFRRRRWLSLLVTLTVLMLFAFWAWLEHSRLGHVAILTGSALLTSVLLLALIGLRRRLPVLPLGSFSSWTQVHIYLGLFASGVYVMHVPTLIGDGIFEGALSIIFLSVAVSGFYGIYATRRLPKLLTAVEGQHRFDRVGWYRSQIAVTAKTLLEELEEQSGIRVLGSFYESYLRPFFNSRPSMAYVLAPTGVRRRRLLSGLRELNRYLETEGRSTAGRFAALVRRRDDLDYQYALQLRLRIWLVVHGLLTFALIVGGVLHAVLALRFIG